MSQRVDFNADLGEGGDDVALMTAAVEAAQRFSVQTMARKYEALYEERA